MLLHLPPPPPPPKAMLDPGLMSFLIYIEHTMYNYPTPPSTDYTKPHPHLHVMVDGVGGSDDGVAGPLPTCKV